MKILICRLFVILLIILWNNNALGSVFTPKQWASKRSLNWTRGVILLEEMDVDLKHLFNDVQSTEQKKKQPMSFSVVI